LSILLTEYLLPYKNAEEIGVLPFGDLQINIFTFS